MTNRELLNERIDASGFKRQYIAEQLGINQSPLPAIENQQRRHEAYFFCGLGRF